MHIGLNSALVTQQIENVPKNHSLQCNYFAYMSSGQPRKAAASSWLFCSKASWQLAILVYALNIVGSQLENSKCPSVQAMAFVVPLEMITSMVLIIVEYDTCMLITAICSKQIDTYCPFISMSQVRLVRQWGSYVLTVLLINSHRPASLSDSKFGTRLCQCCMLH